MTNNFAFLLNSLFHNFKFLQKTLNFLKRNITEVKLKANRLLVLSVLWLIYSNHDLPYVNKYKF